jgi:uncharacterized protein YndB with AHSA1/START domain
MSTQDKTSITVETSVSADPATAWRFFTDPSEIVRWNHASDDWHSPAAKNDLRPGGRFSYRMEARDGSIGFDFGGVFNDVKPGELLTYSLDDGRQVAVKFTPGSAGTKVSETFEAENTNSIELQRGGWQAILDNYRKLVEGK